MMLRRNVEQAVGLAVLALITIGAFFVLRPFLSAILWAAVLTFSTWPLFERLKGLLGGREALAAALMIVAVACVLVLPIAILATSMTDEIARLANLVVGWLDKGLPSLPAWIGDIPLLGARLMRRWHDLFQTGDLRQNLSPYLAIISGQLLSTAGTIANALMELLLSLLVAFFLYCNGPEIDAAVTSMGIRLTGDRGRRLIAVVAATVRSVVKGLLGTNLLQALLGGFGFWLAGVPGSVLLGFFVFFLTVIPFGAGFIWIPAVIWVASTGDRMTAALLGIWCIVVFGLLENIARPFLVGRGSTLPSLLILLGMFGGMSAFGFLGVFLGPALLALLYTLLDEWRAPVRRPVPAE